MTDILKIGLVVTDRAGRLLVVRKHGGATYILPGGKPEGESESDLACLHREVMDELGVHVTGAPVLLGTFEADAADLPGRLVKVRAWRGQITGEPTPRAEIDELRWIDIEAPDVPIADTIAHGVIPALLEARGGHADANEDDPPCQTG